MLALHACQRSITHSGASSLPAAALAALQLCLQHHQRRSQATSASTGAPPGSPGPLPQAQAAATGLEVGCSHAVQKRFSAEEVQHFLRISGDANPLHSDAAAAVAAGLPGPILPGILMASLFPAIIGTAFPGAIYASQTLKFREPALVGEALHARVVVSKRSRQFVAFQTLCESVQRGVVLVEGEAMAKIRPAAEL